MLPRDETPGGRVRDQLDDSHPAAGGGRCRSDRRPIHRMTSASPDRWNDAARGPDQLTRSAANACFAGSLNCGALSGIEE
ncbi:hypothetical protein GCM10022236_29280 [Microlunatus ginsengisoli]|uniref:Uncharacterized protein n=1 Tax=Microlunatus ginsengisoli TaxID=363863 RepID=A0ABP7A587_9ACTN